MDTFLIVTIAVVIFLYILLKFSHLRARLSFLFILVGLLVIIFIVFVFLNGGNFSFSSIDSVVSSIKTSFLWIKSLVTSIFQFTGKAIGTAANNSTGNFTG